MAESCSPAVSLAASSPYKLSLRANFSWTFAGNVVYAACQWGTLVVLVKLGTPVLVGQYALGVAIAAPVIMLAQLQLRSVIASDVRGDYRFGDYLAFRLVSTALAVFVVLAIPLALRSGPVLTPLIFLVGLSLAVEAISDVFYARLQLIERMDRIAKSQMVRGPLGLAAMGLGVYLTGRVSWGVAAMVVARLAVLVGYDVRPRTQSLEPAAEDPQQARKQFEHVKTTLRPRWEPHTMAKILWLSLPLGIVALLVSLNTYIPRYFIQWSLGARELGIYSAIGFLMSAGNLFAGALAQAVFVRLAKFHAERRNRDFVLLLLKMAGIGTVLGAGGILVAWIAGPQLLRIIYRPEYAEQSKVLVWFMVVAWVGYLGQFLGYAMTSARYFVHQIPLFVVVALAITAGSYWLVPRMGLTGGVLANLIGVTVQLLGSMVILSTALIRNSRELPG
jgi:O-antigen/teichoic acid export membrane protein